MSALVLDAPAADFASALANLRLDTVPAPVLDDDSGVRIAVRAVGTNFFDLLQMVNKYQVSHQAAASTPAYIVPPRGGWLGATPSHVPRCKASLHGA